MINKEETKQYLELMNPYFTHTADIKEKIHELLLETKREGIENLIEALDKSNFFEKECYSHHTFSGGLALHSLGAYTYAKVHHPDLPDNSLRIACILHDLCKIHGYKEIGRKANSEHHHHGQRSVELVQHFGLRLTEDERLGIRWHMGTPHHVSKEDEVDFHNACHSRISRAVHESDGGDIKGFFLYISNKKPRH